MVQQTPIIDPQRESADEVRIGDNDAFGAACGDIQFGLDSVGSIVDAWDHGGLHVLHVTRKCEPRDRRLRWKNAKECRKTAEQWQHSIALGLLPPQLFEFLELGGIGGSHVFRLREIIGKIVELPDVLLRIVYAGREPLHRCRPEVPGKLVQSGGGPPTVLVDASSAKHLKVLHGVSLGGLRVVERIQEAGAVHGLLRNAIDRLRFGDPRCLKDSRGDAVGVRELGTDGPVGLDSFRPCHNHRDA